MQYRDLSRITRVLHVCLVVAATLSLVHAWSEWEATDLLRRAASGEAITEAEALASDDRVAIAGGIWLAALLITSVAFLQWTYWVARNARAMGMRRLEYTPGWAVGWYFVPILSLWKPYLALREVFRASHPRYGEKWWNAPHPRMLPVWWALWVLSLTLGNASYRFAASAETVDRALLSSMLGFGSSVLEVPLAAVVIFLSRQLLSWQTTKHKTLTAAGADMAVALPKISPRRTLATISAVQGALAVVTLTALFLAATSTSLDETAEGAAEGVSDAVVVADIARITAFIRREWQGEDPPVSLVEVQERWMELDEGAFPYDPFDGLDYGYEQDGVGFRLWSSGADGIAGTPDDQVGDWVLP